MWEILGIGPTTDLKEIKSAYARLAKRYNPEEYPEEFKRLFDAYKSACKYARSRGNFPADNGYQPDLAASEGSPNIRGSRDTSAEEKAEEYDFSGVNTDFPAETELSDDGKRKMLLKIMRGIISDESKRNDTQLWLDFFTREELDIFIFEPYFRAEASSLVFGRLFSCETAWIIASGFGRGSKAVPINYHPVKECQVIITEGGKNPPKSEPIVSVYKRENLNYKAKKIAVTIYIVVCVIFVGIIAAFVVWDYNFQRETAGEKIYSANTVLIRRDRYVGNSWH